MHGLFSGQMPFLAVIQQRQSTKGIHCLFFLYPSPDAVYAMSDIGATEPRTAAMNLTRYIHRGPAKVN